jgi:RNA polymerase sigma-70 factor (ECF subfamily)
MLREKTALEEVRSGLPRLFPRLWRYCLALTSNRDRANDLAQAACLHALEKARHFEPGTHLDRWLFRLTQRLWLNELRADAVRAGRGLLPVEEIDLADNKSDPHANLYAKEVLSAVMGLPEAQRVTVMLVYVEGHSYREAAEILDIPAGTVMSRLAAARKTLALRLVRQEKKLG